MRNFRGLGLTFAAVVALALGACSSGPCNDYALVRVALNEKAIGCEKTISSGVKSVVLPELVDACEPYAAKYCSDADRTLVANFRTCVEGVAACAGDGTAFSDALKACGEPVKGLSENCEKALSGLD